MSTATFSKELKAEFLARFGAYAKIEEPLAPLLAYRVGGPAELLVFPRNEAELVWIADKARAYKVPLTIIGSGTNLLVVDEGIRGIVVSLLHAFQEIELIEQSDTAALVRVGGGVGKPAFLEWAITHELTGLEFSSGVPGTIGGGIYMNAGTKYGSYGDILKELRLFDFRSGARTLKRDEVHFGYRHQTAVGDTLVLNALFELKVGDGAAVRQEVDRIIAERAAKQPLDFPSCGSTFKNPEGHSAGRLIEKAGLKGTRVGGAEISQKHANFILNLGQAKARDILTLIDLIRRTVKEKFGVDLETEVITLGPQGRLLL
jgi:UDP-N-acetylmuramate dehydrogenase